MYAATWNFAQKLISDRVFVGRFLFPILKCENKTGSSQRDFTHINWTVGNGTLSLFCVRREGKSIILIFLKKHFYLQNGCRKEKSRIHTKLHHDLHFFCNFFSSIFHPEYANCSHNILLTLISGLSVASRCISKYCSASKKYFDLYAELVGCTKTQGTACLANIWMYGGGRVTVYYVLTCLRL